MWVGIGVGIGRNRFATGIFNAYALRVTADGGITEAGQCVDAVSGLLLNASLLLIPSGYKGGKLYAEIPTNGNGDLTWTRGGDGFRTNASGLIQRVPWNLLQRSEEFANVAWTKADATISANTTTAPNGTLTADTILDNTTNATHSIYTIVTSSATSLTWSIYAKKNTLNFITISAFVGVHYRTWFNLNTGVVGTNASGNTATIQNVGDGWYRCSVSRTIGVGTLAFEVGVSNTDGVVSYIGNGSGAFIWGAQLVEGTTAQTYLPTTDRLNFPRLSYMYGSCPSVLLEPQRTNLALRSEEFDNASWTLDGVTISANQIASPSGTTTADLMTSNGTGQQRIFQTYTVVSGSQYTISIYVKQGTTSTIQIVMPYVGAGPTFTFSTATFNTVSGWTSAVQTLANGWYRISVTQTATSTNAGFQLVLPSNGSSVYLWGAQFEQGAYPTTYISTTSATATRVADSFSRNNIYTNGLITASGGTWFVEFRNNIAYRGDSAGDGIFLRTIGDTDNFRFYSDNTATSRIIIFKRVSNVNSQIYTTTSDTVKIAIKWNGSTADIFANGTKVVSATSFTATQLQEFTTSITAVPKFIQQMALYPSPLSDTDCTTLTTL